MPDARDYVLGHSNFASEQWVVSDTRTGKTVALVTDREFAELLQQALERRAAQAPRPAAKAVAS